MVRILFVCLGNICRSPMAEAVFRHKVHAAGLEGEIEVDSAGTGDWHVGHPAHAGTRAQLAEAGIDSTHQARVLVPEDFAAFDYILTMDTQNLHDVRAMQKTVRQGRASVRPFLDFAPESGVREVPDPYFDGGFAGVYALIDAAADGLLKVLQEKITQEKTTQEMSQGSVHSARERGR